MRRSQPAGLRLAAAGKGDFQRRSKSSAASVQGLGYLPIYDNYMANNEQLSLLKEGSLRWNAWRVANPKILPDLSRANLANANLRGCNLSHADMSRDVICVGQIFTAPNWTMPPLRKPRLPAPT
jgi:uncharacterized protein YjbI with pentapeptide repeats